MNRTGLLVALALAVIAGLTFGLYPQLDLQIAAYFAGDLKGDVFPRRADFWPWLIRESTMWVVAAIVAPAVVALIVKLFAPRARMLVPARAAVFLILTLVLAPGVVVNGIFKEYWARPRPIDVTDFRGADRFMPWWDPRGACRGNCSFVSGDASAAYWTLAPAALAPPAWRPLAYGAALAFGTGVGALRVVFGGHFPSDVIFAGFFTFLVVWICYALLYRRPETANADAAIERALERFSLWISRPFRREPDDKT